MARAENTEIIDRFEEFYRTYYRNEIGELAQKYPNEQKSLYVDYDDLYRFDPDIADDFTAQPGQMQDYAEEALRLYDLPVDVKLGQAHVRVHNLTDATGIREIRSDHVGNLIAVQGIVRKATDVRPKIQNAAFECQRCGTMTRVPQSDGNFQEPHECQGCERQGPFQINFDQSEFVDAQKLRVQESPEGLRGGETPQAIDIHIEDDITGEVTAGDHVTVTGILRLEQQGSQQEKSPVFDFYMQGMTVMVEDEQFEEMDITEADKKEIIELSNDPDIYEKMVGSMAPSIFGYEEQKLAIIMQLFSGVKKDLPDGSRIRGDLHMLLIGDPGTGKCQRYDTEVALADGTHQKLGAIVEQHLTDPKPIDDGVYDEIDIALPSMTPDGTITERRATKGWKREAPDRMYQIRTASGYDVEVTPSHPLFVATERRSEAVRAEDLVVGQEILVSDPQPVAADGGITAETQPANPTQNSHTRAVRAEPIESIEIVEPDYDWVYDLEVEDTHTYIGNNVVSHNSQMLQYVKKLAPRSVYTSGKGSSSAGLTAAAVRDDFGDGQQWTLEAGALVLADQGIAAVDELDKMRCVTGDTRVQLGDRTVRIRDFAEEAAETGAIEQLPNGRTIRGVDAEAWTMTDDGRLVTRPVTAIHEYDAPDTLTEVTLQSGEVLTSTADHPYFVFEGGERVEKPAEALAEDDWVYVPRHLHESASDGGVVAHDSTTSVSSTDDTGVSSAMAAVLGYLAGDGNLYYDRNEGVYGIRFTNAEEELLSDFEAACREAFDAEPIRPPSEQRADGVETVRLSGRKYADEVLDAGMNHETYDGKTLPEAVTASSMAGKAAFIRALADSEASVDTRNVKIHSASYELLLGTKQLLLEFGISSQIQHRERNGKRDLYILAITDADSLQNYERHIGFTLDRKQAALEAAVATVDGNRTILDVIPDIGHLLGDLRSELRLHQSECGIKGATYCEFENGAANVSIRLAQEILAAFESRRAQAENDLEELEDANWESLASIRNRYHVSQAELAERLSYSQQQVSRLWGSEEKLRRATVARLDEILSEVASTDLTEFRALVHGDVKWRRVKTVDEVAASAADDTVRLLTDELAEILGCGQAEAIEQATDRLEEPLELDNWKSVREALNRYRIPHSDIATELDVHQTTVSRWVNQSVETDQFPAVVAAVRSRIEHQHRQLRTLLDRVKARRQPKVYDITVEETHNFVANSAIIHNSEDRSAMHEALEQQSISISKAGINATLKSRCSLLGAANPKYGRFDQYEPMGEQIDLEPALISRFDLIFTVTDRPDKEKDSDLAEHIINTNYAGELFTHRNNVATSNVSQEQVDSVTEDVIPEIEADLLRKYIAYAKRNCFPTMTEEAKQSIRDFYVSLRAQGSDDDAPVPVTARKLEALVRLGEASARVRLSDTVEKEDADRVIDIVRNSLRDIGVDPETGEFDADIVEAGRSKSQRDRVKNIKGIVQELEAEYEDGAPEDEVFERAEAVGIDRDKAEHEIEKLRRQGEIYEPTQGHLRTT
jgi:replicative DNA helicase Mcm